MAAQSAPVLSTPAEHILEDLVPSAAPASGSTLSEEQLYVQYEIKRTIDELRAGGRRRVALQFPDHMLVDAPRVARALRESLNRRTIPSTEQILPNEAIPGTTEAGININTVGTSIASLDLQDPEVKICILADTSYGACCADEVAAEHVDADVIVHYGRACLSPTVRLPVIYVFTAPSLDLDRVVSAFREVYQDLHAKVCLMADVPFSHYVNTLHKHLSQNGYSNVFATEVIHDPASPLPNRTVPTETKESDAALKEYSVFHISSPPTSLLLTLCNRVDRIHIFPTDHVSSAAIEANSALDLRRRYALVTRLSSVSIFGILVNTLSVANYMAALKHCQDLISRAGKKYYVFVVGKINPAKVANFSEIGGWVVIGCWESSLIDSKEFLQPIITPFELELAIQSDEQRIWTGQWISDYSQVLIRENVTDTNGILDSNRATDAESETGNLIASEQSSDDEPPEFDLRTGRYVSRSRPFDRRKTVQVGNDPLPKAKDNQQQSSALLRRSGADVARVNGVVSPAAEFLRTQRTWQGLGSDNEIAYERDEQGKIRGALMEEGRSGVAQGYTVGPSQDKS